MTIHKVIDDNNIMSFFKKSQGRMTSYVTASTSDKNRHGFS